MSCQIRRYVREKEDWEFKRGYTKEDLQAGELRSNFLKQYIINFETHLYKTQEERDWAYLAKRYFLAKTVNTTMMLY